MAGIGAITRIYIIQAHLTSSLPREMRIIPAKSPSASSEFTLPVGIEVELRPVWSGTRKTQIA